MADEKKYTARDAAIAVLQKTEELLKKSELMKRGHEKVEGLRNPESEHEKGVHPSSSAVITAHRHGGKALWADKGASATRFNSKDVKKQVHKEKLQDLKNMPKPNLTKKEYDFDKETGHEDGVNATSTLKGISKPGLRMRLDDVKGAKEHHKRTIQELKDMPKPNLTKKENPDKEQDAKLGEDVEHLCEEHMLNNIEAERKEGHKIVQKSECMKCMGKREKGVHTDPAEVASQGRIRTKGGMSHAGLNVRINADSENKDYSGAKKIHRKVLEDLKNQPKPNLTKKEGPGQNEIGTNAAQEKGKALQKSEFEGLYEDLVKMEEMMKKEGVWNRSPNHSHEEMLKKPVKWHTEQKDLHIKRANMYQKEGNHANAKKHSDMAEMHHHYSHANWLPGKSGDSTRAQAKKMHKELSKSEETQEDLSKMEELMKSAKGVNKPAISGGTSQAGIHLRSGDEKAKSTSPSERNLGNAKRYHKETLQELKDQPKPNLPKSEEASQVPAPTKVREQAAPQDNPHEAVEGNNNPPGTVPSAVPGHGVMKLHHFVGFIKGKRSRFNKGSV